MEDLKYLLGFQIRGEFCNVEHVPPIRIFRLFVIPLSTKSVLFISSGILHIYTVETRYKVGICPAGKRLNMQIFLISNLNLYLWGILLLRYGYFIAYLTL